MASGLQEAGMRYGRAPQLNISATINDQGVSADLGVLMQASQTILAEMQNQSRFNSVLLANGGYLDAATINDHKIINFSIVNAGTSNDYMNQQLVALNQLLLFGEGKITGAPQVLNIEYFNALNPSEKVVGTGRFINAPYPSLSVGGDNPESLIKPYTFRLIATREDIADGFNLASLINSILTGTGLVEGVL